MTSPRFRLTTDHPASRDGVPVLLDSGGNAYGPTDTVTMTNSAVRACDLARWNQEYSGFDPALVARFNEAADPDPRLATVLAMMGAGMGTVLG